MHTFELHQGTSPLLVSLPHNGVEIPEPIRAKLKASAHGAPDTDWFVDRLYAFAKAIGASILKPRYSRYVIDLNRPPDDVSLYPGQNTHRPMPIKAFTGEMIYLDGISRTTTNGVPAQAILAALSQRAECRNPAASSSSMAKRCYGKGIPSAPNCLTCSKAGYRISTSAPPAVPVFPIIPCADRSPACRAVALQLGQQRAL